MVDETAFEEMEIEDGLLAAEQLAAAFPPAKKSRGRKAAAKKTNPAASLIEALKFISVAQKKAGTAQQQFCYLVNHWAVASNEVLLVATKIEEDLNACPHTLQLLDALGKCKDELSIVQLSPETLAINSDKFKALIPCISSEELNLGAPDPLCAAITDVLKEAFAKVAPLAAEGAPNAVLACVLLQANTVVATTGFAMVEAWHGIDLPPGLMIPKASIQAVIKSQKVLTGFGYSQSSVTFYFEDESFIKSQLYAERFPNYEPIIGCEGEFKTLPREFFTAVHAIESFSENGVVYFEKGLMSAKEDSSAGTTFRINHLPEGMAFYSKKLIQIEKVIQKVSFDTESKKMFFVGDNLRGVLMGCTQAEKEIKQENDE